MEFVALLYGDPSLDAKPGTPELEVEMGEYAQFGEIAGPVTKGGEALQPPETARSVRHPSSTEALVTNGPFIETTEVIGGYYVFDVESLDEALELARQIPAAKNGGIEVRPIVMSNDQDTSDGNGQRFLAWIYSNPETAVEMPGTPEWDAGAERHGQFMQKHATSITGGFALHPASTATTVRVRNGEALVTDGPYAETTEVLGGVYVLRATADEVVEVAKDIPTSPGGGVEVRPVWEVEDMMAGN